MYEEPSVHVHAHDPVYGTLPLIPPEERAQQYSEHRHNVEAASREASQREMAMIRALNRPPTQIKPELVLKEPRLPEDFAQQVGALDQQTYRKGVAVSRERLESLGKARFQQLLAADREARREQRVIGIRTDLTDWPSVCYAFLSTGALDQVPVPSRQVFEQRTNRELDEIRQVGAFADLWKVMGAHPRAVQRIYDFRDIFDSLAFGQSMLERLSDDGRVRSKFFCGGSGHKVQLFEHWLPALEGEHHRITLTTHLQSAVFWLAGERSQLPDLRQLVREHFNVRSPTAEQMTFASAVFEGFLLGHGDEWALWNFTGCRTRRVPEQLMLKRWREDLNGRFRRVQLFHHDLERCFLKEVGNHYELDSVKHRRFVEETIARLRDLVSMLAAQAVEEISPGTIVARFDEVLFSERKPTFLIGQKIADKLNAAFRA